MLKVNKLSKKFPGNDFYSLKDVSFEIKRGEVVGLIGKNGAGKSTLMKMIAKSQIPTEGLVQYNGVDIFSRNNLLDEFGIMIDPVFYPDMTVEENLKFYLTIHGKKDFFSNIEPTLKLVELWNARKRKPKGFSFGMKQRTALAIALVAEPNFLILDEPFVGLDPIGVKKLIAILKKWSDERNISMLISSHQLVELESLCQRYLYIENGCLASEFDKNPVSSLQVSLDSERLNDFDLSDFSGIDQITDNCIEIPIDMDSDELNRIFYAISKEGLIKKIAIKENRLQDIFDKE